ncbi:MAG TPA: hypothetical protein VMH78_04320 [Thermoplasmata archaeon]|nr:hypothetical protein [Thermoplasmata archaeon]
MPPPTPLRSAKGIAIAFGGLGGGILIALGTAALLGTGDVTLPLVVVGGVLLALAAAIAVRREPLGPAVPAPEPDAPAAATPPAGGPAAPPTASGSARRPPATPSGRPVPAAPALIAGRLPSTSIPGAYLAAIDPLASSGPDAGPGDGPAPIAAALPFAAMARPPMGPGGGTENADEAGLLLDVELARLRARLRDVDEGPSAPPAPSAGPRLSVSGAARTPPAGLALPPTPLASPASPTVARCAECGENPVDGSGAGRCPRCGRGLCDGWRATVSARPPGLCADCRQAVARAAPAATTAAGAAADAPGPGAGPPGWWDPDG